MVPNTAPYRYIGPRDILRLLDKPVERTHIQCAQDILEWIKVAQRRLERDKTLTVTFIVDVRQQLWINDRHSEHVVCANGQEVLSAGEMTFALHKDSIEVVAVTNQSTGYCPEPESWWAVKQALTSIGIPHPDDFTMSFLFRRCEVCQTLNIVKDGWFECGVCQAPLNALWNCDPQRSEK